MKRIGVVGVPGSGKTPFAEVLKRALQAQECGCYADVAIIDGYAEDIEKSTNLALGQHATYVGNLHVALHREALERVASQDNKVVITCGTLLETATYAATHTVAQAEFDSEAELEDNMKRIQATMNVLACLYMDTFMYDHVFYLPPLLDLGDMVKEMDQNLRVASDAFNLVPITRLEVEDGTLQAITEQRVTIALKEILGSDDSNSQRAGASASTAE